MNHKSQPRKALSLFGLILLTGLFCAAQSAAVFTQGPAVAKQGDSAVVITFTVSEATDVEVGIADANGKIINHLAAGVLGGTYPPPEPLVAGLTQSIVWNLKDDNGVLTADSGYKVRVRLGVKPKFVWRTGGPVCFRGWGSGISSGEWEGDDRRKFRLFRDDGSTEPRITGMPAKYNTGTYVYSRIHGGNSDSSWMVLLKKEADLFIAVRDDAIAAQEYNTMDLARYTRTDDSLVTEDGVVYRIYKLHGMAGDRLYTIGEARDDGVKRFNFIDSSAIVFEGDDPWNTNPQTDFLCKWHPLVTEAQEPFQLMVNSEPEGDVFSIKDDGQNMNRYDASTGKLIKTMAIPWEPPIGGPGRFVAYDGKEQVIYLNDPQGYSGAGPFGYLCRYNMSDMSPAPWPQTGKNYVGPYSHFPDDQAANWEGGDKGLAVGPGGLVYWNSIEDTISHDGTLGLGRMLGVSVVKDGAILSRSRVRLDVSFAGLKVDRKGNIYVGAKVKLKGQSLSEVIPDNSLTNIGQVAIYTGSILKFPDTGGTVLHQADYESDYDLLSSTGNPKKSSGLEWCYYGLSKFCGWDAGCWCSVCSFDLDKWGRLFLPNSMQAEMSAIDNNRNLIYKVRNREMPEAGGIIPGNIAVTDNYVIVTDWMNRTYNGFRLEAQSTWFVDIATGEPYNNLENGLNANAASICTWPNPFVSSIGFKYVIPANKNGLVSLGVYDLQGRLVRELVNKSVPSGVYNVHWDGSDSKSAAVSNGVYVYRFKANGHTVVGRIAVLR